MFTNTLLIYLAFWKLQKTVAKHRRLELSTKRGYGTKRDSSYFMKSQGILTKTVSEDWPRRGLGELEYLPFTRDNRKFRLENQMVRAISGLESFRKYGLWSWRRRNLFIIFQSIQLISYFVLGRPPTTTNFIVLCKLRVVSIFPQGYNSRASEINASARENHPTRERREAVKGEAFSRGVIFTRARVSLALQSLRKNGDYS